MWQRGWLAWLTGFLLLGAIGSNHGVAAPPKWTVKTLEAAPPTELSAEVQAALARTGFELHDAAGQPVARFWPRKELPIENKGASGYAALGEGLLVGVVQWLQPWTDYRKQKVKPGVYTLRFAHQPTDGDHMGTAPYNEFLLLIPAALDQHIKPLAVEELHELSGKSVGRKHPSMMLLFPNRKGSSAPQLTLRPQEHLTLDFAVPQQGGGAFGLAITVFGHTMAE